MNNKQAKTDKRKRPKIIGLSVSDFKIIFSEIKKTKLRILTNCTL
jgi:hypothetical protein